MGGDGEERTEPATAKKRRDERKKGHVFLAQEVITVLTLLGSVFTLRMMFPYIASSMGEFFTFSFGKIINGTGGFNTEMAIQAVSLVFRVTAVPLLTTAFLAIAGTLFQTRGLFAVERMKPDFSKLNPIKGFQNLFSLKSLVETVKNLLKITVLMYLIYTCLREVMALAPRYMYADLTASTGHLLGRIYSMLLKVVLAFIVIAAADFLYQRWDFERQMKMTKQEVKEEYKQTEGDPKIKSRIRQLQREMSQARMMQQVPKADVIIRNPTHVAVALRYHYGEDAAPVVLAKGVDALARRIVAVAEENNITVVENVALARLLYNEVDINQAIPPDLYEAVAEVMVYLYKLGRVVP